MCYRDDHGIRMRGPCSVVACLVVLAIGRTAGALVAGIPSPSFSISIPDPVAEPTGSLRAAMLCVNAYVEKHRDPLRPLVRNVRTPPMRQAARAIKASKVPLAPLAGLLAVVRLAAHARHEAEAVDAVDVLIGKPRRKALFAWLHAHPLRAPCDADVEKHVGVGLKEVLADRKPKFFAVTTGACSDFIPSSYVGSPMNTNDVSITIVADAGRKLDDTRPKLDPRSWATCSSQLWADTYIVETDANGNPVYQNGKPKQKNLNQPLGESFQNETLYENVTCQGTCSIQMMLDVTATNVSGGTYWVQYGRRSQVGGSPQLIGDDGYIKAVKNGNRVSVEAQKTLGFTNEVDANLVYAVLSMIDLTAHLQRLVCCP